MKGKRRQGKTLQQIQKEKIADEYYGGVCHVCGDKFGKGFAFHHLFYKEGEKTYRDFKSSVTYNNYIIKCVKKNPSQYIPLCKKHHFAVEQLKRYKPSVFDSLVKIVRLSQP